MSEQIMRLTTGIVSGYVANNHHRADELPDLIKSVFDALVQAEVPVLAPTTAEIAKPSAAAIKKSITSEYLVSFEDGKRYRTLRRHLGKRGLTPAEYKAKYGLAKDYPMVSPAYSARRSEIARSAGLGQQRRMNLRQVASIGAPTKTASSPVDVARDGIRSGAAPSGGKTTKAAKKNQPTDRIKATKKRAGKTAQAA